MADFSKLYITNKGKALIAKNYAGLATIEFLKMQSSSHQYTATDIPTLTVLQDVKQESLISSKSIYNYCQIMVKAPFTNYELTTGYYVRAFGLIAIDPDEGEILYGVTLENTGNCYMPAYNDGSVSGIVPTMIATVGTSFDVDLTVDPEAVATIEQLEEIAGNKPDMGNYTATIPITGWTDYQGSLYVCNVSVEGIRATDEHGIVSVVQSGTETTDSALREAIKLLTRVSAAADGIVVYAEKVPSIPIPIKIDVFR